MQVGELVTVHPACSGVYVVMTLEASDPHTDKHLANCVMLVSQTESGHIFPMNRKWIEVVSASR